MNSFIIPTTLRFAVLAHCALVVAAISAATKRGSVPSALSTASRCAGNRSASDLAGANGRSTGKRVASFTNSATCGFVSSTPNGIRTRAATLGVRAGPSGLCGWVLQGPSCPDFPSGPSAEHCPVTPGGLPIGLPIRPEGDRSISIPQSFPSRTTDDVQGDADEWLHSLRRDAEPVELDVTGAELIAEARDEAG